MTGRNHSLLLPRTWLMNLLTELLYCCDVLERRQLVDRDESWFWAMRHKVALFRLRMELRNPQDEDVGVPSRQEKQMLLATHPLLMPRDSVFENSSATVDEAFTEETRNRVRMHLSALVRQPASNC